MRVSRLSLGRDPRMWRVITVGAESELGKQVGILQVTVWQVRWAQ